MPNSLDDLARDVRAILPNSELIHDMSLQPGIDGLTFKWFGHTFFARVTREVFEVRGQTLYVTGTSVLLQALLTVSSTRLVELADVAESLVKAEDLMAEKRQMTAGLQAVRRARETLCKLMPQGESSKLKITAH